MPAEPKTDAPVFWTPPEFAVLYRVTAQKVRQWIEDGVLGAIDVSNARSRRPRYRVSAEHKAAFDRARQVVARPVSQPRRKQAAGVREYF